MKPFISFSLFLMTALTGFSQLPTAFYSGKYAGVQSVTHNPAMLNTNSYKYSINLFNIHSYLGNNQAAFKLSDQFQFSDSYFEDNFYGENSGLATGLVNVDILGPSFQFNVGKKNSFAVFSRLRAMGNITDFDGKLAHSISKDFEGNDPDLPYTFGSNANMRIALNAWAEIGASFSRNLYNTTKHSITGGINIKYLSGAGNGYMQINNFTGTINEDMVNQDLYLNNTTGTVGIGFAGMSFEDPDLEKIMESSGNGIGFDLGVVYELKKSGPLSTNSSTEYKLKAAISVTDIGAISYDKDPARSGTYTAQITGAERFYFSQLEDVSLDNYNEFFSSHPQYFTPAPDNIEAVLKTNLPTTLNIDLDYNLNSKFYLNFGTKLPLSNIDDKPYINKYYTGVSLTPRFETRGFSFGIPVHYNELTKMNAGLYLQAGPLFLGSGSVISALISESKQADFVLGISFGGKK